MKSFPRHKHSYRVIVFSLFFISQLAIVFSHSREGYWVPKDPPKCHYIIDVRLDPENGLIEGKETIVLKNDSNSPIRIVALDWTIGPASSIDVTVKGKAMTLLNTEDSPTVESPLYYRLPEPIMPGVKFNLDITFKMSSPPDSESTRFGTTRWYPRLWWDDLPVHDSFSVKLEIPEGFALAASGLLNEKTGRYEIEGARTFGFYMGKDLKTESREIEGVLVTTLFTEKGAQCAAVCMDTAVDAIRFYKHWLDFYPFQFLYIIPGGSGRWGGYPFATGIVVIHGQETFKEGESLLHWQRITAHEIGHEYWGEWVLDPDSPAWLWIGMGIFADTEYLLSQKIDPERRASWMGNYLQGISRYYDTTVDIPPAHLSKIKYDHNNTVIHSKGFSIISALDSVLGRETFERIYKKCLREYGGKCLGWKEFQKFCEKECGQSLSWFFDQWVRSNRYLCYEINSQETRQEGDEFLSVVSVKRLGTMKMPVPVKAVFEDGTEQVEIADRSLDLSRVTFKSQARLKEAILNFENKLAMLEEPLPEIPEELAEVLSLGWGPEDSRSLYEKIKGEDIENSSIWYRLGMYLYEDEKFSESFDCFKRVARISDTDLTKFAALAWMGLLKDLMGERQNALTHYREALKYDTGENMGHSGLKINIDRKWINERLKSPFTMQTRVEIPPKPTAEQLVEIVESLNWKREGKTPFFVYEKTKEVSIDKYSFWFKLGLLLFDSGYYPESFEVMERVFKMEPPELYKFTALTWMGHLMDLQGRREEAVKYYKQALKHDTGQSMQHSQWRMSINHKWLEERLKKPFTWKR